MSGKVQQAVILAAGRGSRLGAMGEGRPKCLVEVGGRPLLRWTLDALARCGIERVAIVGGWQHQALQGWASTLWVNERWAQTNMVASLRLAASWLQREPTLVLYGDGAYSPRCLELAVRSSEGDIVVPVDRRWQELWQRRFPDPLSDAETLRLQGTRLVDIGRRPSSLAEIDAQFMGLVRWTPQGWGAAEARLAAFEAAHGAAACQRLDMTGWLRWLVQSGLLVSTVDVDGGWVEIDSQRDVDVVEQGLLEPEFSHDFRC